MNQTIIRFIEAFIAVFLATFGADAIFAGGTVNLFGEGGLQLVAQAIVAAALLAARHALATQT